MSELVQRTWDVERLWHIGDVAWSRCQWLDRDDWPTALWMDADGRAEAWGWVEQPGDLNLVVDPGRPTLVDEVLGWFEGVADGPSLSVTVLEHETHLTRAWSYAGTNGLTARSSCTCLGTWLTSRLRNLPSGSL